MDDQIDKLSSHVLDRRLVQVVIARTSELIGKTVRESKFRTRFDAAIIALHREGNRQRRKIGDIRIVVWPCHLVMCVCYAWISSTFSSSTVDATACSTASFCLHRHACQVERVLDFPYNRCSD